ncbi:MAG: glycosyltransferase [Chthoniobacteraceae bacterium]
MTPRLLFISNLFPTAAEPYRGLDNAMLLHALEPHFEIRVLSPRPVLPLAARKFSPRPDDASLSPKWIPAGYVPKVGSHVNHLLMARSLRGELDQTLETFHPNVILGSWIYPDCCAVLHLVRDRVPVVAIAQGSDIHHYLEIPARRSIILKALPRAAAVVTRSRELARLLEAAGFPSEKLHTVYNGVDLDLFQPRDQAAARREFFLPESARIVLFVGNFFEVKNPHHLILAAGSLKAKIGDLLLVMAGGGPWEKICRDLSVKLGLESSVIFAGRKTPREVSRLMNAANLLALASENEGVPNVILEAFASGLPVVASRVGGIPEVLDHDFLGRMFPAGDLPALSLALEEQLAAPRDVAAIRARAERFSWQIAASKYREILLAASAN